MEQGDGHTQTHTLYTYTTILLMCLDPRPVFSGTMTVEEIYQDRTKFNEAVFNVASRDLANMGITVISFTLQSISDEVK